MPAPSVEATTPAQHTNGVDHAINRVDERIAKLKSQPPSGEDVPATPSMPYYTTMVEWPDVNYHTEVANLPVDLASAPIGTDVMGFRKWLKEDGARLSRKPLSRRFRPEVKVHSNDVPITYGEGNAYSIRVHDPDAYAGESIGPRAALIFYHGGGWIHGDPQGDHDIADFFASELRAVVFNVDYRLAPEHQFPALHDDCYHAVGWVIEHAAKYNVDISRIGLWGCSAGANLAAGVALHDAAEHNPSRIRHPVTCHPDNYPAPLSLKLANMSKKLQIALQGYLAIWSYFTSPTSTSDPYASVLLATPPAGHASVHIAVGGCDFLRDEGIAYALRLRDAGIDTQLEVIPGVPHGLTLAPAAHVAKQFFRDQARVLNSALNVRW